MLCSSWNINFSLVSFVRFCSVKMPALLSRCVGESVCLYLLKINLIAFLWTASILLICCWVNGNQTGLAYSSTDRTRVVYAISLVFGGACLRRLFSKNSLLRAVPVMLSMWASHLKSFEIVIPRYLWLETVIKAQVVNSVREVGPVFFAGYCQGNTFTNIEGHLPFFAPLVYIF